MPAANPADSTQPLSEHVSRPDRSRRIRRLAALLIALPVAASFVIAQPPTAVNAAASPRGCERWHSLTQPPDTIRVLRTRSNNVQTVSFRRYVLTVMAKEWPSYLPQQVVEAGSVAVKQYAWYHALYTRRSSRDGCFDVKDNTGDQIYRPRNNRPTYDHFRAVDATWNVSLRKRGNFFLTAYRRGAKVRCGRDSNGNRLYALSAKHCAERHGYGWRQILREYYGNITFNEGRGAGASRRSVGAPGSAPASSQGNVPAALTKSSAAPTPNVVNLTVATASVGGSAAFIPGLLPENADVGAAEPTAPVAMPVDDGTAPAVIAEAVASTITGQSWAALSFGVAAALASVAFPLKRRRAYLR